MKRLISLIVSIFIAGNVYADACTESYGNVFTSAQKVKLCSVFGLGKMVLANNTYLKARNAANSADLDVLKVDTGNSTVLNAATGTSIKLAIAGTNEFLISNDTLTFEAGVARIAGGDAVNNTFFITADTDASSASAITFETDNTVGGNLTLASGALATADVKIQAADEVIIETKGGVDALVIDTASGNAELYGDLYINEDLYGYRATVSTGITAAGTDQTNCTALTRIINAVATVAASTGVCLTDVNAGVSVRVQNLGANNLEVYPTNAAGVINSAASGAGITLAAATDDIADCTRTVTNQWICTVSAGPST